jgi:hypothetical protein
MPAILDCLLRHLGVVQYQACHVVKGVAAPQEPNCNLSGCSRSGHGAWSVSSDPIETSIVIIVIFRIHLSFLDWLGDTVLLD